MSSSEISGKEIKSDTYEPERNKDAKFGVTVSESLNPVGGMTRAQLEASINAVEHIVMNEDVPTMPEDVFVGHFLRTLAGLDPDTDGRISLFYRGGNGFHKPVNIVDRRGHVLFQVPPLYKTDHINALVKDDKSPSVSAIVTAAHVMATTRPKDALETIQSGLMKKFTQSNRAGFRYEKTEAAWMAIFERYNLVDEVKAVVKDIIDSTGLNGDVKEKESKNNAPDPTVAKPEESIRDFVEDGEF